MSIIPVLAAIIFNKNKEVLLAQRNAQLSQPLLWEFPGGKLKIHESPEDCLKREIREELGIEIEIKTIFTAVNFSYKEKNILLLAYIARFKSGEISLTDHRQVKWSVVEGLLKYDISPADLPIVKKLIRESREKNFPVF